MYNKEHLALAFGVLKRNNPEVPLADLKVSNLRCPKCEEHGFAVLTLSEMIQKPAATAEEVGQYLIKWKEKLGCQGFPDSPFLPLVPIETAMRDMGNKAIESAVMAGRCDLLKIFVPEARPRQLANFWSRYNSTEVLFLAVSGMERAVSKITDFGEQEKVLDRLGNVVAFLLSHGVDPRWRDLYSTPIEGRMYVDQVKARVRPLLAAVTLPKRDLTLRMYVRDGRLTCPSVSLKSPFVRGYLDPHGGDVVLDSNFNFQWSEFVASYDRDCTSYESSSQITGSGKWSVVDNKVKLVGVKSAVDAGNGYGMLTKIV